MAGIKISQLDGVSLPDVTGVIPVVDGGITKKLQLDDAGTTIITGAVSEIIDVDLTGDRAVQTDGDGKIEAAAVTATELDYLSGATGNIQDALDAISLGPVVNLLGNGNFVYFDLGAAPTATDNAYFSNLWRYLTDATTNRAAGQQSSSPPDGSRFYARLTGDKTISVNVGMFQVLRAEDAIPLRGKTVSLSLQAKVAGSSTLYAGVLAWTGTADAITGDPVATWAAVPTMVANWTFENTPASLGVTTNWATYTIPGIVLDTASFNNLAVFIWAFNNAPSPSITLDVTQVQLQVGPLATAFVNRLAREERDIVSRNDYTFTAAPAVSDDITKWYGLGSRIIDVTNDDEYVCVNPATGAAVWDKTTP